MKPTIRKAIALGCTLVMLGALTGLASADDITGDVDSDAVASPHANDRIVSQAVGTTVDYDLSALIKETSNDRDDVFRAGFPTDKVTVAITRTGDWLDSGNPGSPASFEFSAYDTSQSGTIRVAVPSGASGTKTMTAVLSGTASNGRAITGLTLTWSVTATAVSNPCGAVATPAAPVFAHSPDGDGGWYDTVPTVSATSTTSGATVTYGTTAGGPYGAAPTLTDGQTTVYAIATSATCNKVSSESSQLYKVDTTDPTVTITTPAAPSAGLPQYELGQTVLADFSCDDTVSLIRSCVGTVNDNVAIDTSSEGTKSFAVNATDNAGNTFGRTHDYTVRDTVAPVITFDATGAYAPTGNSGWFKTSPAKVKVNATDLSGVTALECTLAGIAVTLTNTGSNATSKWGDISTTTEGQSEFSCGATDGAATPNTTALSARATHTLKLDTVAPVVTVTNVAHNAKYLLGQVPVAGCNTTDVSPGSGVLTSATIATAPTNALGEHTVTCGGAVDNAGNTGSASATYRVVSYTVTFQQPIDGGGVRNIAKLGRVLPVKMTVVENDGSGTPVAITDASSVPVYLRYVKTPCSSSTPSDTIEEWAAGSSATGNQFDWDTTALRWHYNLDTRRITSTANTCYRVEAYVGGTVNSSQIASGGLLAGSFTLEITK